MAGKFYTIDDVARMLQISISTVRNLIREGEIEAIKIGKQWRISEENFNAYVARQSEKK